MLSREMGARVIPPLLHLPWSINAGDGVVEDASMVDAMVGRAILDDVWVYVTEAIDGFFCAVWRDGEAIISDRGYSTLDPALRRALPNVLVDEDIEIRLVYPRKKLYASLSHEDALLVDLSVNGERRPRHELEACARELGVNTEPVIYQGGVGIGLRHAIDLLNIGGSFRAYAPRRSVIYWLQHNLSHVEAALYDAPPHKEQPYVVRRSTQPSLHDLLAQSSGDRAEVKRICTAYLGLDRGDGKRARGRAVDAHEARPAGGDAVHVPVFGQAPVHARRNVRQPRRHLSSLALPALGDRDGGGGDAGVPHASADAGAGRPE